MTPQRRQWLRAIARLAAELRRPPTISELAAACRMHRTASGRMGRRAAGDGLVAIQPRGAFGAGAVQLAPRGRLELDLPLVVYLAWPLAAGRKEAAADGRYAAARLTTALALSPVSPYLAGRWGPDVDAVAAELAARSDAVVVWRDPLLTGRSDVAAARRAGLTVAVITDVDNLPAGHGDLWRPPYVESTADSHHR
jgi:hypothetical protein